MVAFLMFLSVYFGGMPIDLSNIELDLLYHLKICHIVTHNAHYSPGIEKLKTPT